MQSILMTWTEELPKTLRVLMAFPSGTDTFRAHSRSSSALEIAAGMVVSLRTMTEVILSDAVEFGPVKAVSPESLKEASAKLEEAFAAFAHRLEKVPSMVLESTIQVPVGPERKMPVPRGAMLEMLLLDHVHHRGQLSVYVRLAGGKVPSIYGPSADETPGA